MQADAVAGHFDDVGVAPAPPLIAPLTVEPQPSV
jgi:hypothetical protein